MTAPTDALRALDPRFWEVEVRVSGERVLTIGNDHLAGISNIEDYADTVRKCGEHLLSFLATPAGSASGEDAAKFVVYRLRKMAQGGPLAYDAIACDEAADTINALLRLARAVADAPRGEARACCRLGADWLEVDVSADVAEAINGQTVVLLRADAADAGGRLP